MKQNNFLRAILYLAPALIILITFSLYPAVKVFLMSFYTKYNYFKHHVYEYGLDNYIALAKDEQFIAACINTLKFVLISVPISIILSLLISVLLVKNNKINTIIRNIYFLPFITSTVAVAVVFRWIFHSRFGLLNYALGIIGIKPIAWLTDSRYAMTALIILCVWKTLGYNILIILTGLRNIPQHYYSAARIDGAVPYKIFFRITLPLLMPTVFFVSITSLIGAFKTFSEVYALFHRSAGPLNACMTIVYFIYDKLVNQFSYGISAAASFILFFVILLLTVLSFTVAKLLNKHYGLKR